MKGQMPIAETHSLTENVGTSDVEKLLHDYVKPTFLRLSPASRQKALDYLKQLASEAE